MTPAADDLVSVFLLHDGRVLLLCRGDDRWRTPGATLRGSARETAYAVLASEIGLDAATAELAREGEPLTVHDPATGQYRRVHPLLFTVGDGATVRPASPDVRRRWVWPGEIGSLDTPPGLADALQRVFP